MRSGLYHVRDGGRIASRAIHRLDDVPVHDGSRGARGVVPRWARALSKLWSRTAHVCLDEAPSSEIPQKQKQSDTTSTAS